MNLILFEKNELAQPLSKKDPRAQHIRSVLKLSTGDSFKAGVINESEGFAHIIREEPDAFHFEYHHERTPEMLVPLTLVIGFVRPIQARRILKALTALGICRIEFIRTQLGEKSYEKSNLWQETQYRQFLIDGAQQAGGSRLPEISICTTLGQMNVRYADHTKVFLDVEHSGKIHDEKLQLDESVLLAVGPERGWSEDERRFFLENDYRPLSLGKRILKTETAAVLGAGFILQKMGVM